MIYLIDGHNLIPKIPGLSLSQIDDEDRLLDLLSDYSRLSRKSIEVFFDKAPAGMSGSSKIGTIKVHYVTQRTIADEAIINRVLKSGKRAVEMVVVSSDAHVIRQCSAVGAKTQTSEQFASGLVRLLDQENTESSSSVRQNGLSEAEVDEWLKIFGYKE